MNKQYNPLVFAALGMLILLVTLYVGSVVDVASQPMTATLPATVPINRLDSNDTSGNCLLLVKGENNEPDYVVGPCK